MRAGPAVAALTMALCWSCSGRPAGRADRRPPRPTTTQVGATTTTVGAVTFCRAGNPLANVYRPSRLQVLDRCKVVSGVVMTLDEHPDGDVHFTLRLDPPYVGLVNQANVREQYGFLVVEIVPADRPGCVPGRRPASGRGDEDLGVCTGANVETPHAADHVTVVGPYVLDTDHGGWAEIHPAWYVHADPR